MKTIKTLFKIDQLILCLSTAFLGILFAGRTDPDIWLLVTIAVISAKIAHRSFYKIMDNPKREKSPRYRERMIPQGEIKTAVLWLYGIFSSAIFIFSCLLINELTYLISILAVFLMIFFPLIKRYSSLPFYYLGIFESLCPIAGFIAANGRFEPISAILTGSIFFWIAGHEISRAIYETGFDKERKIFSIPAVIGSNKAQVLSVFFYIISLSAFITAGIFNKRGLAFWISLICFAIIIIKQEILLKAKDVETAKQEFLQINIFIAPIIFIGTLIDIFYY
jgi:4-hydroxybenzoate polyprenyltransferase